MKLDALMREFVPSLLAHRISWDVDKHIQCEDSGEILLHIYDRKDKLFRSETFYPTPDDWDATDWHWWRAKTSPIKQAFSKARVANVTLREALKSKKSVKELLAGNAPLSTKTLDYLESLITNDCKEWSATYGKLIIDRLRREK